MCFQAEIEKCTTALTAILPELLKGISDQFPPEAETEEQLTRALKWFLVYPQATLRQAKRSGQNGRGPMMVAQRFQAVMEGDWGRLLEMLSSDKEHERRRREVRRRRARGQFPVEEDLDRKRDVVLGLAAKGQGSQENRLQWSGLPGESSHHNHPQGQVLREAVIKNKTKCKLFPKRGGGQPQSLHF